MRFRPIFCSLSLLLMAVGCAPNYAGVSVETYHGWPNSYRITNGTIDVVVVPSIGRIMRYAYVGDENLLWENPDLAGKTEPPTPDKWANFGGDKVFAWPQDDWNKRFGRTWPPPRSLDPLRGDAIVIGDRAVRLSSAPIAPFGFRIVREIRLAPVGTRLAITTRFEQINPTSDGTWPVAVWTVTQWRSPKRIFARGKDLNVTPLMGHFKSITARTDDLMELDPPGSEAVKVGLDANELAAIVRGHTVVQRLLATSAGGDRRPGEQAQIYCDKDATPPRESYTELEFTSPRFVMSVHDQTELQASWEIRPSYAPASDDRQ